MSASSIGPNWRLKALPFQPPDKMLLPTSSNWGLATPTGGASGQAAVDRRQQPLELCQPPRADRFSHNAAKRSLSDQERRRNDQVVLPRIQGPL